MMDDASRRRYEQLTEEVRRLKSDCDTHFYVIGAALSEVKGSRLYAADGYDDFRTYLDEAVGIGRDQARKWISVADGFTEALAAAYGVERCYAYLRYIEITPEDDRPADIERATLAVPQRDGTTAAKPVKECTVPEIEAAGRLIRSAGAPQWSAEVKALYGRAQAALGALGRVGVSLSGDEPRISFTGIPAGRVCEALRVLSSGLGCGAAAGDPPRIA